MSERERVTPAAWWLLAVLLLLYVLAMMDRLILTMLVEPIKHDLVLTDFQISLILGPAFAFANALAVLPLGWASDRYARKYMLAGAVAFWSVATSASSLARSFGSLFVGRIGVAAGEAALLPAAYSLIADHFPKHRFTTALAIFNMGPKLGTAAAYAAGALVFALTARLGTVHVPLLGELSSWRLALALIGAPGLLLALLTLTVREPLRRASARASESRAGLFGYLWSERRVYAPLLAGFALMGVCSGALNNWVPAHLTRTFGATPVQYGPTMSLISLLASSAILFKGMAVDWLTGRGVRDAHVRFYTWLQALCLPLLIAAFLMPSTGGFLLLFGAVNVVALSYLLYVGAIVQLVAPTALRGQVSAVFLFCSSVLAQGIAPSLVAALTDFVFRDPARLGDSLGIVSSVALTGSFLLLRLSLRTLRAG